jgi:hypothetical protein
VPAAAVEAVDVGVDADEGDEVALFVVAVEGLADVVAGGAAVVADFAAGAAAVIADFAAGVAAA